LNEVNSFKKGETTMANLENETNSNLASILLSNAAQLNGNARNVLLDGGGRARKGLGEAVNELLRRYKADPTSIAGDSALKPVTEALSGVKDISNMYEIAGAVKPLPIPDYSESEPVEPPKPGNPFMKKPGVSSPGL
jgi:hypothetical protein